MLSVYNRLRGASPFGQTIRFPDGGLFVNLVHPQIKISDVISAADAGINSLSDAKRAFDVAFGHISDIVSNIDIDKLAKNGVFMREIFETVYGLRWADSSSL